MSWIVSGTTDKLQVVTSAVGSVRLSAAYVDNITGTYLPDMAVSAAIVTATTTDWFPASAANHQRRIKSGCVFNDHATVTQNIIVQITDGTNTAPIWKGSLSPGEFLICDANGNFTQLDASGIPLVADTSAILNASIAAQAGFAADTYLVGSSIQIPATGFKLKTYYEASFDVTKTAAGVAAPAITVRIGTAGTIADAARLTFTFSSQTAVADVGRFIIRAAFRSVGGGTSAVMQGRATLTHQLAITGLNTVQPVGFQLLTATSAGFDSTVANSIIGLSVNGGASAAWTTQLVEASLDGL